MPMLALKSFSLACCLFMVLSFSHLEAQQGRRRLGYGVPYCSVQSSANFKQDGACSGQRVDYVGKWNVVVVFEEISLKFNHPFIHSYDLWSLVLGYRFDLDFWLGLITDRKIPILSDMHITFVPFANMLGEGALSSNENFKTEDYSIKRDNAQNRLWLEIGWQFSQDWDVYASVLNSRMGPFWVRKAEALTKEHMTIYAYFLGVHYAFGE